MLLTKLHQEEDSKWTWRQSRDQPHPSRWCKFNKLQVLSPCDSTGLDFWVWRAPGPCKWEESGVTYAVAIPLTPLAAGQIENKQKNISQLWDCSPWRNSVMKTLPKLAINPSLTRAYSHSGTNLGIASSDRIGQEPKTEWGKWTD